MVQYLRVILYSITLFILCSCDISQSRTTFGTREVYEEIIEQVEERVLSDKWMEDRIEKKWYEGHEYLVMFSKDYHRMSGVDYNGFVHNPNCPCKND